MEISFVRETANAPFKNDNTPKEPANSQVTRADRLDSVSGNIRTGLRSTEANPDQLLEQTMEAGASEGAISDAHDFNMARVMELLSDPLLHEDI